MGLRYCVSPSPLRSRCQDRIIHTRILYGQYLWKLAELLEGNANLIPSEGERAGRLGRNILDCCAAYGRFIKAAGNLQPKSAFRGVWSLPQTGLLKYPQYTWANGWEPPVGSLALAQTWQWISEHTNWPIRLTSLWSKIIWVKTEFRLQRNIKFFFA